MRVLGATVALLAFSASAALAGEVSKQQLLDLADADVDVDLVVDLVEANCVDFDLDAETLLELAPRLDKPILEAIFECRAEAAEPPGEPGELAVAVPPVVSRDSSSRWPRELHAVSGTEDGFVYLERDRLVWSRKRRTPERDDVGTVVTFDQVLRFEPMVSHRRKHPDRARRGGMFVRIADGRGMLFDALKVPGDRAADVYTPEQALELAEEMNAQLARYRQVSGHDAEAEPPRDLEVQVRAGKPGTFRVDGAMIEFVPDNAGAGRHAFRLLASRVSEIRINGWGEAALRFERDPPLGGGEYADLEVHRGWIRLYGWEGKGLIREFERRGIEPTLHAGG